MFMDKINLDKVLFHGLAHRDDSIEDPKYDALKHLDSVLKTKSILSRKKQKEILELSKYAYQFLLKNGNDYVCVCKRKGKNKLIKCSEAFYEFVESGISLILDTKLLEELEVREQSFQDGEIQIRDEIPLKYLVGIAINCSSDESCIKFYKKSIKKGLDRKYIEEDLKHTHSILEEVQQTLKRNKCENIKIYSILDGKIITNIDNILNELYKDNELLV